MWMDCDNGRYWRSSTGRTTGTPQSSARQAWTDGQGRGRQHSTSFGFLVLVVNGEGEGRRFLSCGEEGQRV